MYSKIVRKHGETLEHRVVGSDVDEVYVPIVRDGVFIGAFEIYYDITARKQILDALVSRSAFILYIIASSLLLSVILMLFKAGSAMLDRMHTEQKLQESNNRLEERVAEQTCELQVTQETSIEALSVLAEHHDAGTGEHLTRIQEYVVLLATWLKEHSPYAGYINSRPDYIVETELASLLHDIGKIAIPKEILLKPGKLTMEEFDLVKEHTRIAAEVLDKANKTFVKHFSKDSYLALARDIALYHHERWNGSGYPDGLKGEAIPLSARIVALADVYDALRSARPYKAPNTHKDAVQVIIGEKGQHFDPYVVEAFMAQVEKFHEISSRNNSEEKRVID
jgi:response regulator RpfG family c-di-GMP phosphodiesterase